MDGPSPELQAKIQHLQALSQQLQSIGQQRAQFEAMKAEAEQALEALGEVADDAQVFRSVGGLLLQDDKAAATTRLGDDVETMEVRVKRLRGQEEEVTKTLQSLQDELQQALGPA